MNLRDLTTADILRSIWECIRMGTEAFLRKYGYAAGRYMVKFQGHMLPSKAIVGVAAGLSASEFSGGQARLGGLLERLGFVFIKVMVVALVGCGASKQDIAAAARDLYTGTLFRKAAAFADRFMDDWVILSALHGVVDPDTVVEPYNQRLSTRKSERTEWHQTVLNALSERYDLDSTVFFTLCGKDYREGVEGAEDVHTLNPFFDARGIGDMLSFLTRAMA